jgi:hypothetical protein
MSCGYKGEMIAINFKLDWLHGQHSAALTGKDKDRSTPTVSTRLCYSTLHTRAIRERPPDGVFATGSSRGPRYASATIHLPDLNIGLFDRSSYL